MKHAKKLLAALLALAMMLAMAVPAFAATTGTFGTTKGTITINKAVSGQTYKIYRIFDLESFDDGNNAYSYKLNATWNGFKDYTGANTFFTVNAQGYIEWAEGKHNTESAAEFAKLAKAYLADHTTITPIESKEATGETVTFANMDLGYYLVDTSLGTLLSLNTSHPDATIDEKNVAPTIDKVVSAGTNYGASSDAQIGDTVYYKVTIHAKKGAEGYVLNDTMSEGLTFNNNIVIKNGANTLEAGTDYTVKTGAEAGGCTFVVEFAQSYLNGLATDADLEVTYTATLNEKAVVGTASTNKAELKYGENHNTVEKETTTNTYKFDLVKIDGSNKKLIDGALFKLYEDQGCTKVVKFTVNGTTYKVSTAAEGTTDTIAVTNGMVTIEGLDKKIYYLKETQAPSGYNTLTGYVDVNVSEDTVRANVTTTTSADGTFYTNGGKAIENNKGTLLPSTGGIGTTIFYVIGGGLMVAAAVLLITKKRMENKDN